MGEWGTGTRGLGDMVPLDHLFINKTNTPLGLDMGTWGLGDIGGNGERGHGSVRSPIFEQHLHTFRVRQGDMGFRGHGGEMGTREHGV